jgi:hypothetical protein
MIYKFTAIVAIFLFLALPKLLVAQNQDAQTYTYSKRISTDHVVKQFSRFKYKDICADTVLVTQLGKSSRSKDLTVNELQKWMYKNYHLKNFKFGISAVVNDGYMIIIGQYSKKDEIPIRFFSLFLSHETGKVVVIEIEENK